jgi:Asp-tRNA(Asn)/Glu-tRNA(Gln) amidotransferase A subunit family amidase
MTGWERLGIGGQSQGFLSGRLSPSAALDDALAGIAAIDDDLSAFVAIDADGARRAVAELKRGRWRGQLHGVRIRSLVLPSNEHAIQRDPNEVIIGM